MAKIINSFEGQRLYELDKFHSMLSDDYLGDKDHTQTKFIYEQFFKNNSKLADQRLALLNISYAFPSLITEKFADYVGQPVTTFDFDMDSFISSFIWGGFAVFRPKVVDGQFLVDYTSPSEYVLEDSGIEHTYNWYYVYNELNQLKAYVLEQIYDRQNLTRKLWKITKFYYNNDYSVDGEQVALDTIAATRGLSDFEVLPSLTTSPLVKVHNRKIKSIKYGTSEISKVRSLISSIEIEAVNIQDQFLKHLQAKLAVPMSSMKTDKDGVVNLRDMEVLAMEAGDNLPAYIINTNPLIQQSFVQIEAFTRQIAAIINLPVEFFGLKDGGGAESAETRKIKLSAFIKKIEKIRSKFEAGLLELNEIQRKWIGSNEVNSNFSVVWPGIFPEDTKALADELQVAQDAKLISNKRAIMKYQGLDEKEAEIEKKTIDEEHATIDASVLGI